MRPIRLELSAFGPYLEHTVIDFEKLNEAGLKEINTRICNSLKK